MSGNGDGPIARWSRRKTEARVSDQGFPEPEALEPATSGDKLQANLEAVEDRSSDEDRPPLPPIEDLDANSDYTQFLVDGVPEALTRAALRKLWLSDPVLANLDGLNDYDEDFNLIDKLIAAIDTNYKVGRGMLSEAEAISETSQGAASGDRMVAEAEEPTETTDEDDDHIEDDTIALSDDDDIFKS
ncbi:MAG: DUF3306 domain-containing protein [Alphaproteobacteria bacterium]|nr:DUF3306 domain-containing protein [Alphaproteobacteria bacterium]MBL6954319.1 DUF3306 domain-containing protein [Alphaproteobacteria bacterium]